MKKIIKGTEPLCLTKYRQTKDSTPTYDDYRPKTPLQQSLLDEQGYICCYCMQRIRINNVEIDHFLPKAKGKYPEFQLTYSNLIASCNGNRGNPEHLQHCNARKHDDEIQFNPADPNKDCEAVLKYSSSGAIISTDATFNEQLNIILNLNNQTLVNNRKAVLDGVIFGLNKMFPSKPWSKVTIAKFVDEWKQRTNN
jgi:uncharacterized protein (TIGR02646 family)